jgi:hypothetical protein
LLGQHLVVNSRTHDVREAARVAASRTSGPSPHLKNGI